ncbi:hypothetical protein [Pandoraea apista]|nr:hypothetical protein [Pandoraea apista]
MSSSTAPQPQPESPAKRLRAMADEMADICILIHQIAADLQAENSPN